MDTDELFRLLSAFDEVGLEYVLIGGAALNIHGIVRATEDVDVVIRASEENVERLKTALRSLYPDPEIDAISPADLLGDYPAVRYSPPDEAQAEEALAPGRIQVPQPRGGPGRPG